MQRKFEFAEGEFYHLYQRGIDKRATFLDRADYSRFLALLYICNSEETIHLSDIDPEDRKKIFSLSTNHKLISIGAFCLMPNHFHLLVKEETKNGISRFMQKMITAYTMYFNKRYQRTGSLFAGPFRAKHVADDIYLKYLFAYIHLNPVKVHDEEAWANKRIKNPTKTFDFLNNYHFSSFNSYQSKNLPEDLILSKKAFPDYFPTTIDFNEMLNDWINFESGHNVKARP